MVRAWFLMGKEATIQGSLDVRGNVVVRVGLDLRSIGLKKQGWKNDLPRMRRRSYMRGTMVK